MSWSHPFLLCICFSIIISLIFSMFLKGYQREKHKAGREEINTTAQKLQQEIFTWTWNNFREVNGSVEGWRSQDSLPHFRATPTGATPRPRCCKNGGTCVLGSFCVCPAHFTGRYCEHDQRHSECGALVHGAWTFRACRLCRCVFAALYCLPRQTPGRCGKGTCAHIPHMHAVAPSYTPIRSDPPVPVDTEMSTLGQFITQKSPIVVSHIVYYHF
uniref:EGF-like domain-containing protein n=1 Tax=Rhinolophus ferrumequinum TaxID=59479 RepID=A0A671E0F7_RHIFE